ncbi:MAG: family 16 glycosylhydrolase [bacterium]|nr:family 16 glycosylhydrolase [bacterium]
MFRAFLLSMVFVIGTFSVSGQDQQAPPSEPVMLERLIDDFESGLPITYDAAGVGIGFVPWGDTTGNVVLSARQVLPNAPLAIPMLADVPNTVLAVDFQIASWGGFFHIFTDGEDWVGMDWRDYNAFSFWMYGTGSNGTLQFELADNLNRDFPGDSAERYLYRFIDDAAGWRQITIPFAALQRRTDYQPPGAPDDGLGLDQVSGYAFGLPSGIGASTILFDQVGLTTVEGDSVIVWSAGETAALQPSALAPAATGGRDLSNENLWNEREWTLIWSDEFDAAAGTPPNADYWTHEIGGSGWGNNEYEYYTERVENAAHDGQGHLAITAREERLPNAQCHYGACRYTSARLISRDKVEFTYGRVEARIRIPRGQGIWPAFWMLGGDILSVSWPRSGEIDVMENVGHELYTVHGTVHGPGYSGGEGIGASYTRDTPFSADFHIYAIEWDEDAIRWYVDGDIYHMLTPDDLGGDEWVFNKPFFLLLNVAVGGNWPGLPNDQTVFPQTMLVDYVRVYQLASE